MDQLHSGGGGSMELAEGIVQEEGSVYPCLLIEEVIHGECLALAFLRLWGETMREMIKSQNFATQLEFQCARRKCNISCIIM